MSGFRLGRLPFTIDRRCITSPIRRECRENVTSAFKELSDNFHSGLHLLHQADTLPSEVIHGIKVPGGVRSWRKAHEAQEWHSLTANLRVAYAGLIGPLLATAHFFGQPAFDKRSAQRSVRGVWPPEAEERGSHRLVFVGVKDLLLVLCRQYR